MSSTLSLRQREKKGKSMSGPLLGTPPGSAAFHDSYTGVEGKNITDLTISIPSSSSKRTVEGPEPTPARWRTPEFLFYALVFVVVVPIMVYWPMRLSSTHHPNFPFYAHRLSPGWLFGRQVDNSDPQYRTFRSNLPSLLLLSSLHLISSTIQSRFAPSPSNRANFTSAFSVLMILILHGTSALKILSILYLNFLVSTCPKPAILGRFWPAVLIVGNMGVLLLNERHDGYRFGHLHTALDPLDQLGGVLPRWHISFNITMMRMVSFGLDYHWAQQGSADLVPKDYRQRVTVSLPHGEYNLINYIAYCLYPPLYIAGPIMTFNDFQWQLRQPVSISTREKISYAIRFVCCLLTMESVLHTMYVVAIKDTSAWAGDSAADLSMIGFWNLVVVWLKLLIPWRFFRLWALLDGVDPPENMIRCVANNYSTLGFWRSWHRSYNLWVVRYIYIPVGGSHHAVLGTLLVFTFVALWHDLSMKLLAWGWLVSLFIVPELIARKVFSQDKFGHEWWYRHICAIGGVGNILMMMSANLVGFVLGLDGMKHLGTQLTSTWSGITFMLFACVCLFVAVQVMFEYREEEKRRGIDRKC